MFEGFDKFNKNGFEMEKHHNTDQNNGKDKTKNIEIDGNEHVLRKWGPQRSLENKKKGTRLFYILFSYKRVR